MQSNAVDWSLAFCTSARLSVIFEAHVSQLGRWSLRPNNPQDRPQPLDQFTGESTSIHLSRVVRSLYDESHVFRLEVVTKARLCRGDHTGTSKCPPSTRPVVPICLFGMCRLFEPCSYGVWTSYLGRYEGQWFNGREHVSGRRLP